MFKHQQPQPPAKTANPDVHCRRHYQPELLVPPSSSFSGSTTHLSAHSTIRERLARSVCSLSLAVTLSIGRSCRQADSDRHTDWCDHRRPPLASAETAMPQWLRYSMARRCHGSARVRRGVQHLARSGAVSVVGKRSGRSGAIGAVSFSGSVVAFAKLQELLTYRRCSFRCTRGPRVALVRHGSLGGLSSQVATVPTRCGGSSR